MRSCTMVLALSLLGLVTLVSSAISDSPPAFLGAWGSAGTGPGEFNLPFDVSAAPGGKVFVLDTGQSRVQVFTGDGAYVGQWVLQSPPTGSEMTAIAAGQSDDVYVLSDWYDYANYEGHGLIQRYSSAGALLGSGEVGTGYEASNFNCPDIAVSASGDVLVAFTYYFVYGKTYIGYIERLSSDLRLVGSWYGIAGTAPEQIPINLRGIAGDAAGNVFLTDATGPHVKEFTADGVFIQQWGTSGRGSGQFRTPWAITIGPSGHVFVTDPNLPRVEEFTPSGSFVSEWGASGSGPAQFNTPIGISADPLGNVYVADTGNNRIQKFGPGPTPATRTTWGGLKARYR